MLNSFWLEQKRKVFTDYYFIHDTVGTIPDFYRFVQGNVYSTQGGIRFVDSSIITDATIPVNLSECTIEYRINCNSLSSVVFALSEFDINPTPLGQLRVNGNLYGQLGAIKPYVDTKIRFSSQGGQFSVFLNDERIGGPSPSPSSGTTNRNLHISGNAYVSYLQVSNVVNMVGLATPAITKRVITPYTDNFIPNPDRYREGLPSTLNHVTWTGWSNLSGYSNLYLASPNGSMVFAAGTTDGSPQIIGRTVVDAPVSSFQFSRVSNTHVPISIHAYALSGLTVRLDDTPVTLGYIKSVQFPEKFKVAQAFRINGVDPILESNSYNVSYATRLRDTVSGLFLRSNPLSIAPLLDETSNDFMWYFTSNVISSNGYSYSGYRFT